VGRLKDMAPANEPRTEATILRERLRAIEDELREIAQGLRERESLASRDVELREELFRTRRELAKRGLLHGRHAP
jgi:hypothetical protein